MLQRDRQRQRERGTAGGGGAGAFTAEYLVVAGGGGGAGSYGGGGAGGYRSSVTGESSGGGASAESALSIALGTPYTVTVGAGGSGGSALSFGSKGANSSLSTIVSEGGGFGAYDEANGGDGGSGGGASGGSSSPQTFGGSPTSAQGYKGGDHLSESSARGAGGGGAGEAGQDASNANTAGDGGNGIESLITGSATYRAGGGGGASTTDIGTGGLGGGGDGSRTTTAEAGSANTGGGGGGGGYNGTHRPGGSGGSGVVIIRVPSEVVAEFSAGVVYNYIPLDDFNVYEITAAGVSDTVTFSQGAVTTVGESLRFNDDDSAYLSRTLSVDGDRDAWTWSGWVKRGNFANGYLFGAGDGGNRRTGIYFDGDALNFINRNAPTTYDQLITSAVFRDPSSFYHIVAVRDFNNPVSSNRLRIYVNGKRLTSFSTETYPSSNQGYVGVAAYAHEIGRNPSDTTRLFDGYMSDVYFIDGEALDPSRFGKQDADGIWQPISYTGSYGTNGFHLDFADNSTAAALGTDVSGNGNDWTPSGITTDDQVSDTPSVNYCTLNPLNKLIVVGAGASPTFSDGNLNVNGNNQDAVGTFGVSSGKWYYEVTQQDSGAFTNGVGWYREGTSEESIYRDDGNFRFDGTEAAYGASWQSSGDIIGIALDLDNTTISFYKNGVSQGNAKTNLSAGTYIPLIYCRLPSNLTANFGQSAFTYTPPTGFVALNSANLPAPTITDGKEHFQPVLYTGNGTTQAIGGLEFQPDFVWIKNRSAADDHKLLDAVRGATEEIESNTTGAEVTNSDGLTAFNSNGFTVGADLEYNASGENFVAWNWNAGGSTVTNTDGTITSQVRANTDAGFSIVTWTSDGSTDGRIGHGLLAAPELVITKNRGGVNNWYTVTTVIDGSYDYLFLNTTAAKTDVTNGTAPTVTTFSNSAFSNTNTMLAYCFHSVDGFSKFGSYTGNGSADGPFVYTGFRPAFVLVKITSSSSERWWMHDSKREPYNGTIAALAPDDTGAEQTGSVYQLDMLSNGFKLRNAHPVQNASGGTYIFMAFAENPFKLSRAR